MRRSLKWIGGTLAALVGLTAVLIVGGYFWMRGSLPRIEGEIAVAGLSAPVEVLRDGDGLVTIRARNDADAHTALGYVHAQDRLAQMEMMRRMGAGRLSELVGESSLRLDRLMRTLGFYRLAEESLAGLAPETLAALDAYAAGVNAFIAAPGGPLPPAFQVLRARPEPWRPADSLVWARLMALQLSGNWSDEALRLRLTKRLTPAQIAFLWPGYPADGPVAVGDLAGLEGLRVPGSGPRGPDSLLPWDWAPKDASNAWALAGAHTASGRPILANDMHLSLAVPSQWYLARIEVPGRVLAGATAPGVPFMIAGHNGDIAWAFTTTHGDTQDLFVERPSRNEPGHYDTPDGPRPFETREEVVEVRGAEPLRFTVRSSRHGPIVSDLSGGADETSPDDPWPDGRAIALAWPALRPDDRTADAVLAMSRARDWDGFLAALENFHGPQQTILYADRAGTIALAAPARVPIRPRGDGRAPVPGWSGAHDWAGLVPFAELPRAVDPAGGRLVTANNRVAPDGYPHLIAADWPSPHRARRIEALLDGALLDGARLDGALLDGALLDGARLDGGGPAGLDLHAAWQRDTLSLAAGRLLPLLLRAPAGSARARRAQGLLAAWDGRMERARPEPLIYFAWLRAANRALLADELGPDFGSFQRADADLLAEILSEGEDWCDDIATAPTESCASQLAKSLELALDGLEERFGGDMGRWRWGRAHLARFRDPVLGRLPLLGRLFETAVESDGGQETVNRGGPRLRGPAERLFENRHLPTFRALYDLADLDASRFMIAGGQSGNPLSPYHGNLVEAWRDGRYVTLAGGEDAARHRLVLRPR